MDNIGWLAQLFPEEIIIISDKNESVKEPVFPNHSENFVNEPEEIYESQEDDLIFSGNNESRIGIIVYYEDQEWIKPKDRIFLDNILIAVKSSVDKSALINIARSNYQHIRDIITKLPDNHFFIFGLPEKYLKGLDVKQVVSIGKSKIIICPLNLSDLVMEKEQKQMLWQKMRIVFGL